MIKFLFYFPFIIPIIAYVMGIYLLTKFKERLDKLISSVIFFNGGNIAFWILYGIYKLLNLNLISSNLFITFMLVVSILSFSLFFITAAVLKKVDES